MEVKPGYKQTELGVIPEEWITKELGEVCRFTQGIQVDLDKQLASYSDGLVRFLRIENYTQGSDDYRFITPHLCWNKVVNEQDIVVVRYGATAGFIGRGLQGVLANNLFKVEPILSKLSKDFLYIYLKSDKAFNYFQTSMFGGAMPALSFKIVKTLPITLPPIPEQEAIAEALSDADALIESLEQLLTKKRHLKQGAMQELLTGKTRLPGFSGEWEIKRLGEMLTICHGRSQRDVEAMDGLYPILATGGEIGRTNRFLYDKPSVLIGRKGTIDQPQYMDTPFWTVDTLFYSDVHAPNHAKFIFYRCCLINWKQHNEASGVPSLNARTIEAIEINRPDPDEQSAIAAILSDMDAEIAALETKLAKTRQLKQGMMQELLTGKIRLI